MPNARVTLGLVFAIALVLRLVAVFQYADAPNFDLPIGDSRIYVERAEAIADGALLGDEVYFHSSPLYPYLIASVFSLTGGSYLALRILQAVLGSLGCVVIGLLASRLAPGSRVAPPLAAAAAACYGALAFFDIDLLMIFFTVVLAGICLLLLLECHRSGSLVAAVLAGIALGLAATDKTNLLLFVPFGAWFLGGSLSVRPERWNWRPAILFVAATAAMIAPVSIRNLVVGRDLVLVSSSAGVNLFIGNNPEARGSFALPAASGLKNTDLEGSSTAVAESELGRALRPSQVSRYWAGRAWRFAATEPGSQLVLLGLKLRRLFSAYETPNHLDFYFMRTTFVPALGWLVVGAWLVFPLAVAGICWRWLSGATAVDRLYCAYLLVYVVSLLPFFVTARYRLPLVPVLIAYAAVALCETAPSLRAASRGVRLALPAVLAVAILVVHWPIAKSSYSFDRVAMATKYYERARRGDYLDLDDFGQAAVQLKWALETAPRSADAHHNLGVLYESIGYYSGAVEAFRRALEIEPDRSPAAIGLRGASEKLSERGDRAGALDLPLTPFEEASSLASTGRRDEAEAALLQLVRRDPFHVPAYLELSRLYQTDGDSRAALEILERGLQARPRSVVLLFGLAGTHHRAGDTDAALKALGRCLEVAPGNAACLRQLSRLTGSPPHS